MLTPTLNLIEGRFVSIVYMLQLSIMMLNIVQIMRNETYRVEDIVNYKCKRTRLYWDNTCPHLTHTL